MARGYLHQLVLHCRPMVALRALAQPQRPWQQASPRPFAAGGAPPCARTPHVAHPARDAGPLAPRAQARCQPLPCVVP